MNFYTIINSALFRLIDTTVSAILLCCLTLIVVGAIITYISINKSDGRLFPKLLISFVCFTACVLLLNQFAITPVFTHINRKNIEEKLAENFTTDNDIKTFYDNLENWFPDIIHYYIYEDETYNMSTWKSDTITNVTTEFGTFIKFEDVDKLYYIEVPSASIPTENIYKVKSIRLVFKSYEDVVKKYPNLSEEYYKELTQNLDIHYITRIGNFTFTNVERILTEVVVTSNLNTAKETVEEGIEKSKDFLNNIFN